VIRCASMTYEFLVTRELEGSLVRVACTTFQESAGSSHAPGPLCLLIQVVRIFSEPTPHVLTKYSRKQFIRVVNNYLGAQMSASHREAALCCVALRRPPQGVQQRQPGLSSLVPFGPSPRWRIPIKDQSSASCWSRSAAETKAARAPCRLCGTDDMWALGVPELKRQRLLTPGNSLTWNWSVNGDTYATINLLGGADRVTLICRTRASGGDWRPMHCPAMLTWTPCTFGRRRAWWLCPCGRPRAVRFGGAVFGCRHCHRRAYRC
jgi:hypothetical protein